jgi:hypothetical protein
VRAGMDTRRAGGGRGRGGEGMITHLANDPVLYGIRNASKPLENPVANAPHAHSRCVEQAFGHGRQDVYPEHPRHQGYPEQRGDA